MRCLGIHSSTGNFSIVASTCQGRGHIEMMEMPVLDIVSREFVRVDASSDIEAAIHQLARNNAADGYFLG